VFLRERESFEGRTQIMSQAVRAKMGRSQMNMSQSNVKTLTVPEIAIIAVTRGAMGFGAGLLLADKLKGAKRKALGWSLFISGLASTIPIAMHVFKKKAALNQET
jgi:hypothetical protein